MAPGEDASDYAGYLVFGYVNTAFGFQTAYVDRADIPVRSSQSPPVTSGSSSFLFETGGVAARMRGSFRSSSGGTIYLSGSNGGQFFVKSIFGVKETTGTVVPPPSQSPGIPGTPTLTGRTSSSLTLATAPGGGGAATGYRWRISTNSTVSDSDPVHTSNGPTITISGLDPNTDYWIDVRAENAAGDSNYSGDFQTSTLDTALTPPGIPSIPMLVSAGMTSLNLEATPGSGGGATLYRWRISTNNNVTDSDPMLTSSGPIINITGLQVDTNYWVDVRAENSAGNSGYSGNLSTATLGAILTPPGVPSTPRLVSAATTSLNLEATPSGSGGGATLYRWRVSLNSTVSNADAMYTSSGPTISITGLTPDTNYWVDVRGENSAGDSDYSGDLSTATLADILATTVEANAGPDVTVESGGSVQIGGADTVMNGVGATTVSWARVSGLGGTLSTFTAALTSFEAPVVTAERTVRWLKSVTNNGVNDTDIVTITVEAPAIDVSFDVLAIEDVGAIIGDTIFLSFPPVTIPGEAAVSGVDQTINSISIYSPDSSFLPGNVFSKFIIV